MQMRAVSSCVAVVVCAGLVVALPEMAYASDTDPLPGSSEAHDQLPSDLAPAQVAVAGAAASLSITADDSGVVSGVVRDGSNAVVAGVQVSVSAIDQDGNGYSGSDVTDSDGKYRVTLSLPSGSYAITAHSGTAQSPQASVTINPQLNVSASVSAVKSESSADLVVSFTDRGQVANGRIDVSVQEPTMASPRAVASVTGRGTVHIPVNPWRDPVYTVTVTRNSRVGTVSVNAVTTPRYRKAKFPGSAPSPRNPQPTVMEPVGAGANVRIRKIPGAVWHTMVGKTWRPGCIARSRLRLLETNYKGFDGYRHRGQMIVNAAVAKRMGRALTKMYRQDFRIRQMRLVDEYGHSPNGLPGGNDYASMAADNTSAFNCRYVVGREAQHVRSPHSTGRSIDINPWENPYIENGVYPDRYFLNRSRNAAGQFKRGSTGYKIMRSIGCSWGAAFADLHHWDC